MNIVEKIYGLEKDLKLGFLFEFFDVNFAWFLLHTEKNIFCVRIYYDKLKDEKYITETDDCYPLLKKLFDVVTLFPITREFFNYQYEKELNAKNEARFFDFCIDNIGTYMCKNLMETCPLFKDYLEERQFQEIQEKFTLECAKLLKERESEKYRQLSWCSKRINCNDNVYTLKDFLPKKDVIAQLSSFTDDLDKKTLKTLCKALDFNSGEKADIKKDSIQFLYSCKSRKIISDTDVMKLIKFIIEKKIVIPDSALQKLFAFQLQFLPKNPKSDFVYQFIDTKLHLMLLSYGFYDEFYTLDYYAAFNSGQVQDEVVYLEMLKKQHDEKLEQLKQNIVNNFVKNQHAERLNKQMQKQNKEKELFEKKHVEYLKHAENIIRKEHYEDNQEFKKIELFSITNHCIKCKSDKKKRTIFFPCSHSLLCHECCFAYCSESKDTILCPFCKETVQNIYLDQKM